MTRYLTGGLLAAMLVSPAGLLAGGQAANTNAKAVPKENTEMRLSGCISRDIARPGQFNFLDNDSGDKYRLTGKGLKRFVNHRVEIVGGPPGKSVAFRTGLWPSPNVAAQA